MWIYALGIGIELVILGILSGKLLQLSYTTLYLLTHSRPFAITILTIFLFPGTVIHELSHLFTAEVLGVRTGTLTLTPEGIDQEEIKSGSVQIAVTDPFRRTLIGIAPTTTGLLTITGLSYWLSTILNDISQLPQQLLALFVLYLIITISNTMFTSKEDLVGVLPVAIVVALFIGAYIYSGIRIYFPPHLEQTIITFLTSIALYLSISIGINLIAMIIQMLIHLLLRKPIRV